MKPLAILLISLTLTLHACSNAARAVTFRFINIADTTGPFSHFESTPVLNNDGTVAFVARSDTAEEGIYIGDGTFITTIADTSGPLSSVYYNRRVSINNHGVVVFNGRLDNNSQGVYAGDGNSPFVTLADDGPPILGNLYGELSLNDAGVIAFNSGREDRHRWGIYKVADGNWTTVDENSTDFNEFRFSSQNNQGQVAYYAEGQRGDFAAIRLGDGINPTHTVADYTDGFTHLWMGEINDHGQVIFGGNSAADGQGLYVGDQNGFTKLTDVSGPYSQLITLSTYMGPSLPAINNNGDVAFVAKRDGSQLPGIYRGLDPATDLVIQAGVPLFGDVLSEFRFDRALNDDGSLAFFYRLDNNVTGIAVASVASPGDIDLDGDVDLGDLSMFASNYGALTSASWQQGDFDEDGDIDLSDLAMLAGNYETGQAQAMADFQVLTQIPEPVSVGVAMPIFLGMLLRRQERGQEELSQKSS